MSRGTNFLIIFSVLSVLWFTAFTLTQNGDAYWKFVVRALPSYSLIVLGCYGLFEIGRGIMILKDYPQEHKSLLEDIRRAKTFMQSKGLTN